MYDFDKYGSEVHYRPSEMGDRMTDFVEMSLQRMVYNLLSQGYNVSKRQYPGPGQEVFEFQGMSVLCSRIQVDAFTEKVVFVCEVAKDWYQKERFLNA